MADKTYTFIVEGTAADGQTYKTEVELDCELMDVWDFGMRLSFDKLTQGKAVYGKPGVGCRGPYEIDKITIERKGDK